MAIAKLKPNRKIITTKYMEQGNRIVAEESNNPTEKQKKFYRSLIIDLEKAGFKRDEYLEDLPFVFRYWNSEKECSEGTIYSRQAYAKAINCLIDFGHKHDMFEQLEIWEDYDDYMERRRTEHKETNLEKYNREVVNSKESFDASKELFKKNFKGKVKIIKGE